jgi:hypothetical protein
VEQLTVIRLLEKLMQHPNDDAPVLVRTAQGDRPLRVVTDGDVRHFVLVVSE